MNIFKSLFKSSSPQLTTGEFIQGVNFAGEAITLDGQRWDAYDTALAQGLSVPGVTGLTTSIQPKPRPSKAIATLLNTVIYKPHCITIHQSLPNDSYQVCLWFMENFKPDWHSFEVKILGQVVGTQVGQLPYAHWAVYGPYTVTVNQGVLEVVITSQRQDVDAHIMGMSLFKSIA